MLDGILIRLRVTIENAEAALYQIAKPLWVRGCGKDTLKSLQLQ